MGAWLAFLFLIFQSFECAEQAYAKVWRDRFGAHQVTTIHNRSGEIVRSFSSTEYGNAMDYQSYLSAQYKKKKKISCVSKRGHLKDFARVKVSFTEAGDVIDVTFISKKSWLFLEKMNKADSKRLAYEVEQLQFCTQFSEETVDFFKEYKAFLDRENWGLLQFLAQYAHLYENQ